MYDSNFIPTTRESTSIRLTIQLISLDSLNLPMYLEKLRFTHKGSSLLIC